MNMKYNEIEKRLIDEFAKIETIDCHEHLPPEEYRTCLDTDVFTLFTQYTHWDLLVAGMKLHEYQELFNRDIPIETRWKKFEPFWKNIRYSSYSRAILIALEKIYGYTDINEKNYRDISEKIKESNKPGIYEKVIRKVSNIKTCLTQCGMINTGSDLLTPLMPLFYEGELFSWKTIEQTNMAKDPFKEGATVRTLDDYIDLIHEYILKCKSSGVKGFKWVVRKTEEPNRHKAIDVFNEIKSGKDFPLKEWPEFTDYNPLLDYVLNDTIRFVGEQDMPVAVHTGYWGDFRNLYPLHVIPVLYRHPNVRFDVYHLGYPWMRETIMLGHGFPNVWLNLCWVHVISERYAMNAVDELLDTMPTNKIFGFGGDYRVPIEKIYGHIVMARENIARVFAKRIEEGRMTEDDAIAIARKWFYENPKEVYRLEGI